MIYLKTIFHVESNNKIKKLCPFETKLFDIFHVNIGATMLNNLYNILSRNIDS